MNKDDNRGSITIVRSGVAAGYEGPRFFLTKGEKVEHATLKDMPKKHGAPPGSEVVPTPNAYMTDDAWNKIAPAFAKGLRQLPIVKDYPDLWMAITLDGYGSHLENEALQVFADHKILVVKEEGDTSQVCQPYDKNVAREDKRHHRNFLNGIRTQVHMVDQNTLVLVANSALNKVRPSQWRDSHDMCNLRPSTRKPFNEYIQSVKDVGKLFLFLSYVHIMCAISYVYV